MKAIWNFISEHWPIFLFGIIIAVWFVFGGSYFSELKYGVLRLVTVIVSAFAVVSLVFGCTVRPYINSGALLNDFRALDPSKKLYLSIGIIALVTWVSTQCFVHP